MTVEELVARFPEIPASLRGEPLLAELAQSCGDLLRVAHKPGNCSVQYDAGNHYYMALIAPLAIHGYGLSSREKVLGQMQTLVDRAHVEGAGLATNLVPAGAVATEVRGCS